MYNSIKIIQTTPEELKNLIIKAIEEVNNKKIPTIRIKPFTKEEAIEFLSTTQPTLDRWCKQGKLTKIKIGGRAYIKADTVHKLVNEL